MAVREIAGPAGRLEALLDEPSPSRGVGADGLLETGHASGLRAAVVFAHPHTEYGGTMHTKVVYQAAKALGRIGCAVLRFNFRGAGASAGRFSDGPGEMDDCRAALDFEPVARSPKAKFFIQGERDELCPLKEMREFYARCAEPKELAVIDGADHLFDGKVSEVADAIEDLLGYWNH